MRYAPGMFSKQRAVYCKESENFVAYLQYAVLGLEFEFAEKFKI